MSNYAIKVENVTKKFLLPHQRVSTLKAYITNPFKRTDKETQLAVNDVSFEVKKGEFFGVVGRNGSGKSTLLKCMAGVYQPDEGQVHVSGSLVPFIELGVGFNPELSGRDNVFLNGALLGIPREKMEKMYQDIVEFAELEQFMDQKLKNYSSGMQVRLAFSISIKAQGDILLLDEVLAVGDANFQKKCNNYFQELVDKGKTVVLVTHNMTAVKKFCSKAMLIENGRIKAIGEPDDIANQYSLDNLKDPKKRKTDEKKKTLGDKVKYINIISKSETILGQSDSFIFDIEYELEDDTATHIGISVLHQNVAVIQHNTRKLDIKPEANVKKVVQYKMPLEQFNTKKDFRVTAALFNSKTSDIMGFSPDHCNFHIREEEGKKGGLLSKRGEWIYPPKE